MPQRSLAIGRLVIVADRLQTRSVINVLIKYVPALAEQADVGISTIQKIEDIDGEPRIVSTLQWRLDARDEAVTKIVATLKKAGITFLPANAQGVGLRWRIES